MGMLLPDETYEAKSSNVLLMDVDEIEAAKALAALRRCDEFLNKHGIRPEFFCRHRERLALQAWLLKRSKLYSGKSKEIPQVEMKLILYGIKLIFQYLLC